jgi:hypothetical protein
MDNWFTSVPLATELLKPEYKLTILGTIRRYKPEIPPEMFGHKKNRAVGTSMFCFDGAKTLVSYKINKNLIVLLLSTCHETSRIDEHSKEPDMIEFYNSTKGAVDSLDQMCNNMSCSRKIRRWPLCIFYDTLS